MDKKKQILKEIKNLFNFSKELKFLDVEVDGKTIRVDGETMEVDSKVSLVEEDVVTLVEDDSLDGEYTYEDNTFTIVNGVITSIAPIEEEPVEEPVEVEIEMEVEVEVEEPIEPVEPKKDFDYESQVETLISRVTIYEEQIAELRTVQEKYGKVLSDVEDYLSDTPSDKKMNAKKFKKESGKDTSTGLNSFRNIRNRNK